MVSLLPDTNLAVLKVRAGMTPGSGFITLTDLNPAPAASGFGLLDGTNLDEFIFAPGHANFPLQVIVVPEPSSLALAVVAVVGIGIRKSRRRLYGAI